MANIQVKLVVVGDGGVGKTSLFHAFAKKEFLNDHIPYVMTYTCNNAIIFTINVACKEISK